MIGSLAVMAAVVTIPPPAEAATVRPEFAVLAGLGSPDWAHLGVLGRYGQLGASLAAGNVGLGYNLSGAVRWWFPTPVLGAFAEAGAGLVVLRALTDQTPGDIFPLGFVSVGWQLRWDHWLLEAAIGPPPSLLGAPAAPPLIVLNALDLPRFRLGFGYAF